MIGNRDRDAFFISELIVVLALVVLLVSLSIPHSFFLRRVVLQMQLEKFALLFMQLQQRAIASNKQEVITVDVATNSYTLGAGQHVLPAGIQFNFLTHVLGPPAAPTQLVTQAVTFPNKKIIFYPDGTVSAGTLYMTDEKRQLMCALTCPVAQFSLVHKYRYNANKWVLLP